MAVAVVGTARRAPLPTLRLVLRPRRSLLLDAAGLDELRPLLLVLVDEGGVVLRRARSDFSAVLRQLPLHLVGGKRGAQLLVEPLDDGARRARRRRQSVIERGVEPGQH